MSEFLRKGDIIIDPGLQNRSSNPVTKGLAKMFLDNFESSFFEFDGVVGFIFIDDGDIYQDFLSGNLCRETIEEIQQSGDEPTDVGRIRFEASGPDRNLTFRILVEPTQINAPVMSAYDHYERGMDSNNLDFTIKELDACLCANPEPSLAMLAYYNLSAAVWEKFGFNDRRGDSIEDDEYTWVCGCNLCLRRALNIYESMPRHQQLESDTIKLHQAIKESLTPTVHKGAYVYRYGQRQFRTGGVPPLRCLTEIKWGGSLDR